MFLCFFFRQGGDFVNRLLRNIADCNPCSLTTLGHCVIQGRQTSTTHHIFIPLHPCSCPLLAEVCDKVPRTTFFSDLLCPDRLYHTFLTMDIGIWNSSQAPKLFSAILVIFQVGSPILTMAASNYNPSTDTSHIGGIICKYHHVGYCLK
jgi:hypothetical protein